MRNPLSDSEQGKRDGRGRGALCHVQARAEYLTFRLREEREKTVAEQ